MGAICKDLCVKVGSKCIEIRKEEDRNYDCREVSNVSSPFHLHQDINQANALLGKCCRMQYSPSAYVLVKLIMSEANSNIFDIILYILWYLYQHEFDHVIERSVKGPPDIHPSRYLNTQFSLLQFMEYEWVYNSYQRGSNYLDYLSICCWQKRKMEDCLWNTLLYIYPAIC